MSCNVLQHKERKKVHCFLSPLSLLLFLTSSNFSVKEKTSLKIYKNLSQKYPFFSFFLSEFFATILQCPPFPSKFHLHHKPPTLLSKIPLIFLFWGPFWGFHFSSIQCSHRKRKRKLQEKLHLSLSLLSLFTLLLLLLLTFSLLL